MNNDIRISCSFPEHYKTKKLIAIAGHAAPFSLISLWVYAARNKPDGFLDNMDNFDIEIASNWTGQPNQGGPPGDARKMQVFNRCRRRLLFGMIGKFISHMRQAPKSVQQRQDFVS